MSSDIENEIDSCVQEYLAGLDAMPGSGAPHVWNATEDKHDELVDLVKKNPGLIKTLPIDECRKLSSQAQARAVGQGQRVQILRKLRLQLAARALNRDTEYEELLRILAELGPA